MRYALTAPVGSWYSYSLAFSPIVEVKLSQPVTLGDFFAEWVWPTRNLVAAATGRREEITYLTCTPVFGGEPRPPRLRHFQVFNPSITQEPYGSTNDLREKDISAIRLKDGESLLKLLRRWQELRQTADRPNQRVGANEERRFPACEPRRQVHHPGRQQPHVRVRGVGGLPHTGVSGWHHARPRWSTRARPAFTVPRPGGPLS